MATNYTTKTAALKATKADMRQVAVSKKIEIGSTDTKTIIQDGEVSADKMLIGVDVKNAQGETERQRQSVLELIQNAGLNVGADADGDYTPDASTTKTNRINFMGAYVNVVPDSNGDVNIYIGENKNNPSYSSITDTLAAANYVYASSESKYALPSDAKAGESYGRTSSLSGTENVNLNNGEAIGNILADQTITVTVTSDKGTITYTTGKISEQGGTVASPNTYTWSDTEKGIAVKGTSLIKYANADAQNGFTPNSSTGIFTVTITNAKVVGENGGWYNVSVNLGSTTKSTSKVFVYPAASATPSVGKPVITYAAGTTKYISGLAYDSSGSFTLTVDNIANTQQAITKDKNRVKVTKTAGDVDFSATVATDTTGMSVTGTATDETAVYKYVATLSATGVTTAKKVSAAAKAQAYGQSTLAGSEQTSDTCTATTWLYTSNSDDTDLISYFHKDGKRVYNTLADVKGNVADVTYDSEKSLIGEGNYTSQLLIQNGKLMYPNSDATGRYSGATETRYYVRPVKFGGSGQINTITVTVSGLTSFNNSNMRMYLVKKGVADAQVLNWFKTASCSYGAPIADATAPSSNKWTCTINNDVFQLIGGTTGYYLVVEMGTGASAIGQITLA